MSIFYLILILSDSDVQAGLSIDVVTSGDPGIV